MNNHFFEMEIDRNKDQFVTDNSLEQLHEIRTEDLLPFNSESQENKFIELIDSPQFTHFDRLPDLSDMDGPNEFEVDLDGGPSGKSSWMYSPKLSKVFVKMDARFTVDLTWKLPVDQPTCGPIFLRAMVVYSDPSELDTPVLRCPNHRDKEKTIDSNGNNQANDLSPHILRCNKLYVKYVGQTEGRSFGDRLAVLIPIDSFNEKVVFEFKCTNSCSGINRRATAVLFCLEDEFTQLLGKRLMNFKVCSCPKRDKEKEEIDVAQQTLKKRKNDGSPAYPLSKRPSRVLMKVKDEPTTPPLDEENEQQPPRSVSTPPPTNFSVTIQMPNAEALNDVLKSAHNIVAGQMVGNPNDSPKLAPYLRKLRRQMDDLGCKPK